MLDVLHSSVLGRCSTCMPVWCCTVTCWPLVAKPAAWHLGSQSIHKAHPAPDICCLWCPCGFGVCFFCHKPLASVVILSIFIPAARHSCLHVCIQGTRHACCFHLHPAHIPWLHLMLLNRRVCALRSALLLSAAHCCCCSLSPRGLMLSCFAWTAWLACSLCSPATTGLSGRRLGASGCRSGACWTQQYRSSYADGGGAQKVLTALHARTRGGGPRVQAVDNGLEGCCLLF